MIIGVSKLAPNYGEWLRKLKDGLNLMDFYTLPPEDVLAQISSVSAILLTGGSDIHPMMYGRSEDIQLCREIDEKRDELEALLIHFAFQQKIPILGICRGQQMLNVALKGTLYADIPGMIENAIPHAGQEDVYHTVTIAEYSGLFKHTGLSSGTVNSAHHQVVKSIASGLRAAAYSPDGLIEAIEADSALDHPFCMAVQWHPERMNLDNPLSGLLGKAFIEAAENK